MRVLPQSTCAHALKTVICMCLVKKICLTWLIWLVGSKTHEEASIGNGGKKQQKDDRSVERDGDLLLAGSSAGSARSRHGGSVYDLLVAEIKVRAGPFLLCNCTSPSCSVWAIYRWNSLFTPVPVDPARTSMFHVAGEGYEFRGPLCCHPGLWDSILQVLLT